METSIRIDSLLILGMMLFAILAPVGLCFFPYKSQGVSRVGAILLGVSALLIVLLSVLFDTMLGISASWGFTVGAVVLSSVVCLAVHLRYRSLFALFMMGLLSAFLVLQHFMDLSPIKPYRRFFAAIQPGMTEAEVLMLLQREFPDDFRFPRPVRRDFEAGQMGFFLDPTESAWNAESVFVRLSDDRVVSKQYSRD